jgi:hypothetical protein
MKETVLSEKHRRYPYGRTVPFGGTKETINDVMPTGVGTSETPNKILPTSVGKPETPNNVMPMALADIVTQQVSCF